MKKVQVRLSEQTYEDLVRAADGVPLQRVVEGMIEREIERVAVDAEFDRRLQPRDPAHAKMQARLGMPGEDRRSTVLAERQARLNKGKG